MKKRQGWEPLESYPLLLNLRKSSIGKKQNLLRSVKFWGKCKASELDNVEINATKDSTLKVMYKNVLLFFCFGSVSKVPLTVGVCNTKLHA